MPSLSVWFENLFFGGSADQNVRRVAAVIGSGGKTSLIWRLAGAFSRPDAFAPGRKILITPTAKMLVPPEASGLYDYYFDFNTPNDRHRFLAGPSPGITLAGTFNTGTNKLEALPPPVLEEMTTAYDLVLAEADGSRGLPLKAWCETEPVVPPYVNHTIGILPLWPIGKAVSGELIHRLELFLALTGAAPEEIINNGHLLKLITGNGKSSPSGLFAKALGKKILFFNQIEDEQTFAYARNLSKLLPSQFRSGLSNIIAGSVKLDSVEELG